MGLQLASTGSVAEDINNIIDGLNTLNDSDNISNTLNITAYGQISITILASAGTFTGSFLHNLGYFPVFIVKVIAIDNTDIPIPFFVQGYHYNSGSKTPGIYPYSFINADIDEQNITVRFTNIPNTPGFVTSGQLTFSFLLFSRPIHG